MISVVPVALSVRSLMNRNCDAPVDPQGCGLFDVTGLIVRADVVPEIDAEHVVQRDEDRELRHHREARGERIHLVLPVELHHLLVHPLLVVLEAFLELLHLRLEMSEPLHRVELLERQREQARPHEDRQRDDRPAPAIPMLSWKNTRIAWKKSISGWMTGVPGGRRDALSSGVRGVGDGGRGSGPRRGRSRRG